MSNVVRKLEAKLVEVFKDTPKLSAGSRDNVVQLMSWLAALAAVLQTVTAYRLWKLLDTASSLGYYRGSLSRYYSDTLLVMTSTERLLVYVTLALLAAQVGMLFMSFARLKIRLKSGWNLAFQAAVLSVVTTVLLSFIYDHGVDSLILWLLTAVFALYLLFQTRDVYKR